MKPESKHRAIAVVREERDRLVVKMTTLKQKPGLRQDGWQPAPPALVELQRKVRAFNEVLEHFCADGGEG